MDEKIIDPESGLEVRWTDNTRKEGDPELPVQSPFALSKLMPLSYAVEGLFGGEDDGDGE